MKKPVSIVWPEPLYRSEEEIRQILRQKPQLYQRYQCMTPQWRARFLDFCLGKKSLPLIYDPFFHYIFDPDIHTERLERFISSVLGHTVRIRRSLPREGSLMDGETYLVMDLLVELEDGALVNVEIQKHGYAFPVERISCYAADLLLRQYVKIRGERGKFTTYGDIKKVCVIVLFENTPQAFHACAGQYLHHGQVIFDTGLSLEMMTSYHLIALDVFREIAYAKEEKSEQKAWLSLLVTENLADAEALIAAYPWLETIYQEIALLRRQPEEVLGMWSEALRILDENSMKYYVDQLQEDVDQLREDVESKEAKLKALNTELEEKRSAIEKTQRELSKKQSALEETQTELSKKQSALNEAQTELSKKQSALDDAQTELGKNQSALTQAQETLAQQKAENQKQAELIAELKRQLAGK